jgi:hypothetical protein
MPRVICRQNSLKVQRRSAPPHLASIQSVPQKSPWFPVFFPPPFAGNGFFLSSRFRHHSSFFFGRFPCVRFNA